MQKKLNENLINLLGFFDISKDQIVFDEYFEIWVIGVSQKYFNKEAAICLEYLIHQLAPKDIFLKIDFNNIFSKKLKDIKDEVNIVVNQAKYYNQPIALKNKNAFERRIAHIFIDKTYGVKHESIGEGDDRQIIIYPN